MVRPEESVSLVSARDVERRHETVAKRAPVALRLWTRGRAGGFPILLGSKVAVVVAIVDGVLCGNQ